MKKIIACLKRPFVALFAVALSVCAFAQEGGTSKIDTTMAEHFMDEMETAVKAYWTAVEEPLYYILGLVVVLTLIWLGIKLFRRATRSAG